MMRFENFRKVGLSCAVLLGLCAIGSADEVHHLNSAEAARLATVKPQPVYPPMAKQLHLYGRVEVEASIDETGAVDNVHPISGNLLLSNAVLEAIRHWRFAPIVADGKPARALATIDFIFKE